MYAIVSTDGDKNIMEEMVEKPGFFERVFGHIHRHDDELDEEVNQLPAKGHSSLIRERSAHITVRRQVVSFQDAVAAADGLKRGEQQILNLTMAPPDVRDKVKDFMCGVNYTTGGTWEEIGEHIFLLAPPSVFVEVARASPRMEAELN